MKPLEAMLQTFLELHPEDAALAFEDLKDDAALRLYRRLPPDLAITLLERVSSIVAAKIIEAQETADAVPILGKLPKRQASSVLSLMNEESREACYAAMSDADVRVLKQLASFPEQTAGAMMEPKVASLPIDLTAKQAIALIRKTPSSALHYLYVTDREGILSGVLTMRDLLLAAPSDPIRQFVRPQVVSVPATLDQEDVVNLMRERRFMALPVVDFEGRLVGVVRHNEALQAGQEEAFEDLQKLVGAGADERALSPVSVVVKSRLPWLCVNLLTAFAASAVISMFEGILAKIAALAVLLPIVAGQGGNTGAQALAVVMRGLALREILPGSRKRVIFKELLGGLANGVAVAVITGGAVYGWRLAVGDSPEFCTALALVIGFAMVVNMVAAAGAGAVIPLLLRALGRDPAQSASIFLTTVTDIVGFTAFLGFAVLMSQWLLP